MFGIAKRACCSIAALPMTKMRANENEWGMNKNGFDSVVVCSITITKRNFVGNLHDEFSNEFYHHIFVATRQFACATKIPSGLCTDGSVQTQLNITIPRKLINSCGREFKWIMIAIVWAWLDRTAYELLCYYWPSISMREMVRMIKNWSRLAFVGRRLQAVAP